MLRSSAHESSKKVLNEVSGNEEQLLKVHRYLDRDFDSEFEESLLFEIESDPVSLQLLHQERSFRSMIKQNFIKSSAPLHLKNSILEKIRQLPTK